MGNVLQRDDQRGVHIAHSRHGGGALCSCGLYEGGGRNWWGKFSSRVKRGLFWYTFSSIDNVTKIKKLTNIPER